MVSDDLEMREYAAATLLHPLTTNTGGQTLFVLVSTIPHFPPLLIPSFPFPEYPVIRPLNISLSFFFHSSGLVNLSLPLNYAFRFLLFSTL